MCRVRWGSKHTTIWEFIFLFFAIFSFFNASAKQNEKKEVALSTFDIITPNIETDHYIPISDGQIINYSTLQDTFTRENESFLKISIFHKEKELFLSKLCSLFIYHAKFNFNINLTSADIIFPFHYFW